MSGGLFRTRPCQKFLELQCKLVIAGEATVIHGQYLANPSNGQFSRAGQTQHKVIRGELFEFPDGMNSKEHKGFASLRVILKHHIQWCIDGNSGTSEFAGWRRITDARCDGGFSNTFFASGCLRFGFWWSGWPSRFPGGGGL